MTDEGFREYWAAYGDAEGAISEADLCARAAGGLEGKGGADVIGLGLVAVARAIQAQTLGLRLREADRGR